MFLYFSFSKLKMEKIKYELKSMQSYPRLYLGNYFDDLKREAIAKNYKAINR
jgi:hypothetical protein